MTGGYLILEDGRRFAGELWGGVPDGLPATNTSRGVGEVVFQTGMSGYQEVITDPSYCGQILVFTTSHLGNTGITAFDHEAERPAAAGVIVRSVSETPSSWRSQESLPDYLRRLGIPALTEVDTRALTRHIRESGALRGLIAPDSVDPDVALARVRSWPGLAGRDLVREVAPREAGEFEMGPVFPGDDNRAGVFEPERRLSRHSPVTDPLRADGLSDEFPYTGGTARAGLSLAGQRVVLIHCGMKGRIDRILRRAGAAVRIVPPTVTAEELLRDAPDWVLVSNGPGDPAALTGLIGTVRGVIGRLPVRGICLGCQVLALALDGKTFKMKFGHHGINHPVRDTETGRVLVTSQNHGFAVEPDSLRTGTGGDRTVAATITHESLNDGVLEGFAIPELGVRAVQFHPEAAAGPHDGRALIARFGTMEPDFAAARSAE